MSKGRMQDVQNALQRDGWEILNCEDLLSVEREVINWKLFHPLKNISTELDFHLFGDLGQSTDDLRDILYCKVRDRQLTLYFEKQNSATWDENLREFIYAMRRMLSGRA